MVITEKEMQALALSKELWNKLVEMKNEFDTPDELNDINFHILSIQRIIYTKLYIKTNGKI